MTSYSGFGFPQTDQKLLYSVRREMALAHPDFMVGRKGVFNSPGVTTAQVTMVLGAEKRETGS